MQFARFAGLRFRLLILALLVAIPIMGWILYTDRNQRHEAIENAQDNVLRLTTLAASEVGQYIEGARQFLLAISHLEEVHQMDAAGCSHLLAEMLEHNPVYSNLAVSNSAGDVFCSAIPSDQPVNLADRSHFQAALQSQDFVVGEYVVSRFSEAPGLGAAYSIRGDDGEVLAVVTAILDFNQVNRIGRTLTRTAGSAFNVIDGRGTFLARYPNPELWVGRSLPDAELIQRIFTEKQGLTEIEGPDGVLRIYAFTPVNGTGENLFVAVGTPKQAITEAFDQELQRQVAILALVLLMVIAGTIWFANAAVLDPVEKLLLATRRLASGDMSARTRAAGSGELSELAQSFDQMAASLEERTAQLRSAEANYRTLVEQIPAITYRAELDGSNTTVYVSPQVKDLLGYTPEEILDTPPLWSDSIFEEDRERVLKELGRIEKGIPWSSEYRMVTRVGEVRWFRNEGVLMEAGANNTPLMHGVMFDITESVQRKRELEALVNVTSALRNATTQEEMFPIALSQILDVFEADGASIALTDPGSGDIVIRLGFGEWAAMTGQRLPAGSGLTSEVIARGQPYVSWDTQRESSLVDTARQAKLRMGVCVPLNTNGQAIGAIWIGKQAPITDNDIRLLTAIADVTANAIHRVSLLEQTQLRLKRLSALHSIDIAITSSLDLQVTLDVLLDQVIAQMGVHAADIMILDEQVQALEYAAGRGFNYVKTKPTRLRLGEKYAGEVALNREMISIPDFRLHQPPLENGFEVAGERFFAYFAAPLIAKGQVKGVLELFHRAPFNPDPEWQDFLQTLATQAAIAMDNAELFNKLQRSNDELALAYDATIEGWSHALELRDQETQGHTQRVTELTLQLARFMGIRDPELGHYRRGVLLHDIGKMAIPDGILLKPGPLSPVERDIMRRHPRYAYDLLSPVPYLRPALDIPYCHHERWDGSGYPRGLKGVEIPMAARIFSVVDVWDALRSERPYRSAWPVQKVTKYIRSHAGTHFDPQVVDTFLEMVEQHGIT